MWGGNNSRPPAKTSPNCYSFPYQLKNHFVHLNICRLFVNAGVFFNIILRRPGKVRTSGFHKKIQLYKLTVNKSYITVLDHSSYNRKTLTITLLGSPRSSLTAKKKVFFLYKYANLFLAHSCMLVSNTHFCFNSWSQKRDLDHKSYDTGSGYLAQPIYS